MFLDSNRQTGSWPSISARAPIPTTMPKLAELSLLSNQAAKASQGIRIVVNVVNVAKDQLQNLETVGTLLVVQVRRSNTARGAKQHTSCGRHPARPPRLSPSVHQSTRSRSFASRPRRRISTFPSISLISASSSSLSSSASHIAVIESTR
jgi:hypothetical protein